ncbi:alternate-type signal peptide domain-containing protein [Nocardioides sp.]|uniref:alternate-type signal peptide domain-containing protein n=1 Tax=Nocardioides sp. TaxID=35761 RepID=UPI003511089D
MRASVRAAIAASCGVVLLTGGLGSLASWRDSTDVPGETITSGTLRLAAFSCGAWTLTDTGSTFVPATDRLVPGEELTRTCTSTLTATGSHLQATLGASTPSAGTGALADELVYSVAWRVGAAVGQSAVTTADDGKTVTATLTVRFPFGTGVDNDANGAVAAALGAVTFTLTQTDD